ncbi:hypothetical protein [Fredinandcohnia sp. 179-A 10B2 NHS]|uniref:hypothetical protein n=1 Tax=Fredinandcohnia sp. 179-A 10B2 NHS TaxID=3235176 RepID=UPI0039A19D30
MELDKKLKHLHKSMDQSVFKNHASTVSDKERLKNIVLYSSTTDTRKDRYYRFTMVSLTLGVTCIFLLVMSLYLSTKIENLEKKVSDVVQADHDKKIMLDFKIKSGGGTYLPDLNISNYAEGMVGSDKYTIYAGSSKEAHETGLLYLVINRGEGYTTSIRYNFGMDGPLKISSIKDQELVLHVDDGYVIYFDILNRTVLYGEERLGNLLNR